MNYIATITSKRQLTIPVDIFQALSLREGEKVLVIQDQNGIRISPIMQLLDRLAGSVKIPKEYQGLTIEKIVNKAKKEHFKNKK